ncbi:hypothetical protein C0Q70_02494 [Pomacea canaliculata]|uniref:Poly [ADP-ribose] polymerase n=2 Tax=Pomacea canaliculata TaxID=400727 RepID=A0A2T7PQ31_POMCA|nr:hypothetical protein C0Q70_02494 [Pomacea canaliculata]
MADERLEKEVTTLLLTEFDGRAKFGKLRRSLYQNKTVRDIGLRSALRRISNINKFLVFEKNNNVKCLSVFCKDASICCGYRRRGCETCKKENCHKFHVCKDFISGSCTRRFRCPFGHDLSNEANRRLSDRLGLSSFSCEDIRTIILCSQPAVCEEYNTDGCDDDDCPDLHVCSRFIKQKCTAGGYCKFEHSIKRSDHNKWVLDTFNVSHLTEEELREIILVRVVSDRDMGLQSQMTPASSTLSLMSSFSATSTMSLATDNTDESVVDVFSFLLKRFSGRARFNTFLTERGHLLGHMGRAAIIDWLKDNKGRFLLYVQRSNLNYVSVYNSRARACFRFYDPRKSGCDNKSCKYFHVCRQFVAGDCVSTLCNYSHSFSSGSNAKVRSDLKLDEFTDSEICAIIRCSNPTICVNHNTSGCHLDDCPDLHVCSKNTFNQCTNVSYDTWREDVLRRLVIAKKGEHIETQENVGASAIQRAPSVGQLQKAISTLDLSKSVNDKDIFPGKYEYICAKYTWTGACPNIPFCPHYHHPDRLPYLWLTAEDGQWRRIPTSDGVQLETRFCEYDDVFKKEFNILGMTRMDFCAMSAVLKGAPVKLKRLSTPSYVTATPGTPLNFYTQWVWYRQERDGRYTPFYPGALQYTLEEKYLKGQHKYYFEFEDLRLMVDTQSSPMIQTNLHTHGSTVVFRRPIFVLTENADFQKMSSLLLSEAPASVLHQVPDYWAAVDRFQDYELVELDSDDPEYDAVQRQFFSTMDINGHNIVHVFRVQNPVLWYKYCSARRAMTPRGQSHEDVAERQLFHGTPTLQAARGICANSFDFRRSGENVGTVWGKGAYFSTTAKYSHSYTRVHTTLTGDPLRFMFLGRILVGQYTLGHSSYTKPPERDRLKMYDSCVNDLSNPTIFVIFDLTQSYPEYLIEYSDVVQPSPQNPPPQVKNRRHRRR